MEHFEHQHGIRTGLIDFTAGSLGGVALVYVSQPLDTVKVKMQTFPALYKGMVDCLVTTYRKDGIYRGLYAGTLPAVVSNVAENSILFAAYGGCQKIVANLQGKESPKELSVIGNAFSGFLAAFFSTFTLCPTELVKCQLQALRETGQTSSNPNPTKHITPFQLTKQIFRNEAQLGNTNCTRTAEFSNSTCQAEFCSVVMPLIFPNWVYIFSAFAEIQLQRIYRWGIISSMIRFELIGIPGFFRGLTSTFTREMPGYFFFFGGYEGTRELLRKPNQTKDEIGPIKTMIAGAIGGCTLWTMIFPADVIKSRIQVNKINRGMLSVGYEITKKEGFLALYNGLLPTILRTIPATATLFVVYEYSKKFMESVF